MVARGPLDTRKGPLNAIWCCEAQKSAGNATGTKRLSKLEPDILSDPPLQAMNHIMEYSRIPGYIVML